MWPELVDPFYDKGAQYAVPYVVFATGLVWRNDKITEDIGSMPNPWSSFWEYGEKYKGKVAILAIRATRCRSRCSARTAPPASMSTPRTRRWSRRRCRA